MKQLYSNKVGAILQAAWEIDQEQGFDGDLYRIVVCLAATGARYAQVRRMRVGDVEVSARRLMMPGSYKGRGGNSGSDPVPVGDDVIEVLLPASDSGLVALKDLRAVEVAATQHRASRSGERLSPLNLLPSMATPAVVNRSSNLSPACLAI